MTILKSEEIIVTQKEADFDRACNEAYSSAAILFRIDETGYAPLQGWDRSSSSIRVEFKGYRRYGSIVGHEHQYTFQVEVITEDNP